MEITYLGHSCFLLNMGGTRVLFDPYITPNPLAEEVDLESIEADYVLLSHGHSDHVADAEYLIQKNDAVLVSSLEITSWFKQKGIEKVHAMNIGGRVHLEFGTVKMVQVVHSNSLPDGSYGGLAPGFVVESAEQTFYYAGDTALTQDMKLLADQFRIDFAFLPIGDNFTMGIHDALSAANFVNTRKIIGMHYDTFPEIEIDPVEVSFIAGPGDKELVLLEIGETIMV